MNPCPARIGATQDEIETPALVVDLDAFERNLAKMAAFAAERGIRLRPHAKTHKCPSIARLQIAAGSDGGQQDAHSRRCVLRLAGASTCSSPSD